MKNNLSKQSIKLTLPLLKGGVFFFAEEKGFEPLIPFLIYVLSRDAHSTALALLQNWLPFGSLIFLVTFAAKAALERKK